MFNLKHVIEFFFVLIYKIKLLKNCELYFNDLFCKEVKFSLDTINFVAKLFFFVNKFIKAHYNQTDGYFHVIRIQYFTLLIAFKDI